MTKLPSGTEIARPFLPAQDFELSKRFYEALGFEKVLDGEVAVFNVGGAGFILQRFYRKEWAENAMMQLSVEDLDAWWAHVDALESGRSLRGAGAARPGAAIVGAARRLRVRPLRGAVAHRGAAGDLNHGVVTQVVVHNPMASEASPPL